jgi:hypothetical protein
VGVHPRVVALRFLKLQNILDRLVHTTRVSTTLFFVIDVHNA